MALQEEQDLVPMQMLAERIGGVAEWQEAACRIIMRFRDVQVVMSPGVVGADVNGQATPMEVAPRVVEGAPHVPLQFVAKIFELTVSWDQATRTVTVTN